MRRKRLKHQVYIFCHMFLGWQLINDFGELKKLHDGELIIDVKTGKCLFGGKINKKLTMPLVLNDWFIRDLKEHSIDIETIELAELIVIFNMHDFESKQKKGRSPEFKCSSRIVADGTTYTLQYEGVHGDNVVNVT